MTNFSEFPVQCARNDEVKRDERYEGRATALEHAMKDQSIDDWLKARKRAGTLRVVHMKPHRVVYLGSGYVQYTCFTNNKFALSGFWSR